MQLNRYLNILKGYNTQIQSTSNKQIHWITSNNESPPTVWWRWIKISNSAWLKVSEASRGSSYKTRLVLGPTWWQLYCLSLVCVSSTRRRRARVVAPLCASATQISPMREELAPSSLNVEIILQYLQFECSHLFVLFYFLKEYFSSNTNAIWYSFKNLKIIFLFSKRCTVEMQDSHVTMVFFGSRTLME